MPNWFSAGDSVLVTSEEHGLEREPGVVTIANLLGENVGVAVKIGTRQYAFFGNDVTRCLKRYS